MKQSELDEKIAELTKDKDGANSDYAHILRFVVSKGLGREYDLWSEEVDDSGVDPI